MPRHSLLVIFAAAATITVSRAGDSDAQVVMDRIEGKLNEVAKLLGNNKTHATMAVTKFLRGADSDELSKEKPINFSPLDGGLSWTLFTMGRIMLALPFIYTLLKYGRDFKALVDIADARESSAPRIIAAAGICFLSFGIAGLLSWVPLLVTIGASVLAMLMGVAIWHDHVIPMTTFENHRKKDHLFDLCLKCSVIGGLSVVVGIQLQSL